MRSTSMSLDKESPKSLTKQIYAAVTAKLSDDIKIHFGAVNSVLHVKDAADRNSL